MALGQWMTEKRGGSDVGAATDTHAVYRDGDFELHGYKWFTSAITSDMTLTLGLDFLLFGIKSGPSQTGGHKVRLALALNLQRKKVPKYRESSVKNRIKSSYKLRRGQRYRRL